MIVARFPRCDKEDDDEGEKRSGKLGSPSDEDEMATEAGVLRPGGGEVG